LKSKFLRPINNEILNALSLLFDSNINYSINLINYLKPEEIKNAYRKMAFKTHPDRAKCIGSSKYEMEERFKKISLAYETINSFLNGYQNFSSTINPSSKKRYYKYKDIKGKADSFYRGEIPNRQLYIAQFLYYSGIISWNTLIQAISWQRSQRPRFGQIAMKWNILSRNDIIKILREKGYKVKFGEYALRKGYISSFEQMAIIGRQLKLQQPIGEYFIQNGILNSSELRVILKNQRTHNQEVKFGKTLYH